MHVRVMLDSQLSMNDGVCKTVINASKQNGFCGAMKSRVF
jgi:hypothetical protein